jgi:hypothetical protein
MSKKLVNLGKKPETLYHGQTQKVIKSKVKRAEVGKLLADTKLPEDPGELFCVGDFARDLTEIMECLPDI